MSADKNEKKDISAKIQKGLDIGIISGATLLGGAAVVGVGKVANAVIPAEAMGVITEAALVYAAPMTATAVAAGAATGMLIHRKVKDNVALRHEPFIDLVRNTAKFRRHKNNAKLQENLKRVADVLHLSTASAFLGERANAARVNQVRMGRVVVSGRREAQKLDPGNWPRQAAAHRRAGLTGLPAIISRRVAKSASAKGPELGESR